MRIAIVLCAGCTACVTETEPPVVPPPKEPYDLIKTKAIAGELPVGGIDGDGAGGLWIAYNLQSWGSAPRTDGLRLVHLDAEGNKLAEHRWTVPERANGIVVDGDTVWVNVGRSSYDRASTLWQVDAASGTTLRTQDRADQVRDLDLFGEELRLGTFDGKVIALDRTSLAEMWRGSLVGAPAGFTGTAQGLTTDADGFMWMMSSGYWLERYTPDRQGAGVFRGAPFEGHHTTDFHVYLAHDVEGLVAATENQISWLVPREAP